jgi:hypothetical protein
MRFPSLEAREEVIETRGFTTGAAHSGHAPPRSFNPLIAVSFLHEPALPLRASVSVSFF